MTTWFIRLGATKEIDAQRQYQALANQHNLIMIGFGIERDITNYNDQQIKNYLGNVLKFKPERIRVDAAQIHKFINTMHDGEMVIGGFSSHGNTLLRYRIGIIKGKANVIKNFLPPKTITAFLNNYPRGHGINDIDNKPAREVKWLTEEINLASFCDSTGLQEKLRKRSINPQTVHDLKYKLVD